MNKAIKSGAACLMVLLALACRFRDGDRGLDLASDTLEAGAPVLVGDVNQDGVVDMSDASAAAAYMQGQRAPGVSEAAADANCNRVVDADDVALIAEASAGLRQLSCPAKRAVGADGAVDAPRSPIS